MYILLFSALTTTGMLSAQQTTIQVFGPGGPYPAINEAADLYAKTHNISIEVTKGPTGNWMDKAKINADIIYSGAEFMMTDFINAMDGGIDETTVVPLYLRPSGLLVRPGNPKNIKDFDDIEKSGLKILVVNGAGQTGLWEGMAGKQGNVETVKAVRKNIMHFAPNSGEAKQYWIDHPEVDVWIIWNIWQVSNPDIADFVPVSRKYVQYRDCGVALTKTGKQKEAVKGFYKFLQSKEAAPIFKKWGWITK